MVSVLTWVTVAGMLTAYVDETSDVLFMIIAASAIPPAVLGWRIVALDPGNVVGRRLAWLGLALTLLWGVGGLVELTVVEWRRSEDLAVRWLVLLDNSTFVVMFLALVAVVIVFPSGRGPSPAWDRRVRSWNAAFAVAIVVTSFARAGVAIDGHPEIAPIQNPLPVWTWAEPLRWATVLALVGVLVMTAVAVRGRFRRATGIERLQLSWLTYAASLAPLAIIVCILDSIVFGTTTAITAIAVALPTIGIPLAITVAVRRYRLYEIERLINRTLVYVALTATLGGAYALVAVMVGVTLGGGTGWATALATIAVAMAFRPARDRLQRVVDHRFARRRYEGLRLVEGFLDDVRAGREEPERIGEVLAQALNDRGLEVFFRLPASGGYAHASGRLAVPPEDTIRTRTPIRRGELELGVILHDPALDLRTDSLERIVRAAALPIEIARLRVEVRVQLAEVEGSRARIVAAADAERRKLERDLHDGAQQRLVALGMALRHAQRQLGADPGAAHDTLDDAVGEVATAVAELREMARGLRPGVLDSGGLAGALSDVAGRSPVPVALEITREQLPAHLEATAFYLACEAVTNAIKHAGARHIRIRVDRHGEQLRLEVADDGVGGARLCAGGGLVGMTQRALAGGGVLHVDSPVGGGTRIEAELPVGLG